MCDERSGGIVSAVREIARAIRILRECNLCSATPLLSVSGTQLVDRDRVQPAEESGTDPETLERAKGLSEYLLNCILRILLIPQQSRCQRKQHGSVSIYDLAECLGVAIQRLLNREKIACIIAFQAC